MTSCAYFSIECSEPTPRCPLHIDNVSVRFFMIGLSGIITSPLDHESFDTPEKLDQIFKTIKSSGLFYVDINHIWLPTELFFKQKINPKRDDVFRIGYELFCAAYRLGAEERSDTDILGKIKQMDIPEILSFSKQETLALSSWNKMQIEMIKKNYHENRETQLQRKAKGQEPSPV